MNIRRVQVRAVGELIRVEIEAGYATLPMLTAYDLDPATALVLAGQLEAAVHTTFPAGLTPALSYPTQTK